jgi:hypothetical protein
LITEVGVATALLLEQPAAANAITASALASALPRPVQEDPPGLKCPETLLMS